MRAVWKWGLGLAAGVMLSGLGFTVGPQALAAVTRPGKEPDALFSQTGRDRAFMQAVRAAKKSIYVRTSTLLLVPFTNELGQAAQNGVKVHIEMPMQSAAASQNETKCISFLATAGAWVEVGSRPASAYEGAYMLVDDAVFYYSAGSLSYSEPGIPHSYVRGKKG